MIIETPNGAVLEVFWRERGAKPWSQPTAQRFLSRYSTDRKGLEGLRWLMADRADIGRTWRVPDTTVIQHAAWLIATDRVIVAEHGGTQRWPGSGFVLGSGSESSLLFWRDRLHLLRDLCQVQEWLSSMRDLIQRANEQTKNKQSLTKEDAEALRENQKHIVSLRELIASAPGVPDFVNLNDYKFLQLVDNYFETGELLPIYHRYPGVADPGPSAPTGGPAPSPKPVGGKDEPDDPSDNPTVPGACLLTAANEGAPFVAMPESGD